MQRGMEKNREKGNGVEKKEERDGKEKK